jgi:hypothetical protein
MAKSKKKIKRDSKKWTNKMMSKYTVFKRENEFFDYGGRILDVLKSDMDAPSKIAMLKDGKLGWEARSLFD